MQKRSNKQVTEARAKAARIRGYVRNIERTLYKATGAELLDGAAWYANAFAQIVLIAEAYGIAPAIACAAVAALSPNNSWSGNLVDFQRLLYAWQSGALKRAAEAYNAADGSYKAQGNKRAFAFLRLQTYPQNALKAYRILASGDIEKYLTGQKVSAFFHNLYHRESERVTIDAHAYSIAHSKRYTTRECPRITKRVYAELSEAYAIVGEKCGITGAQAQAITWIIWRRVQGIRIRINDNKHNNNGE